MCLMLLFCSRGPARRDAGNVVLSSFSFYYHFTFNIKRNKVIEGEKRKITKTLIYFEVHDEISLRVL
jgi:hypothetical protein